jgi:hypothetical protein
MGFFSSIGNTFRSIGNKIGKGARYLGHKSLQGLDYTIQGAKFITDKADQYTFGLDHFIPYYSAIKAGIDISDHLRKMAKGEEKLNFTSGVDMALDVISGGLSAYGGKAELEGLKGGFKMFQTARRTGSSLAEASKIAGGRVLRGYGLHKEQLKELGREGLSGTANLAKAVRKGNPRAIAKVGAGLGSIGAGVEIKGEMDKEQENMRRSIQPPTIQKTQTPQPKPPPRILQKPPPPPPQNAPPLLSIPGLDKRFTFITSDR